MLQGTPTHRENERTPVRSRLGLLIALGIVALMAAIPVTRAGDDRDKLPTAEQVLGQYIEATGGEEAYRKLHNRVSKWELSAPAQGLQMKVTEYAAKPNKRVYITESESFGTFEEGTDGKVAWRITPKGPQITMKEGAERQEALRNAVFHPALQWRDVYDKIECTGVQDVDGKPAYRVVATPPAGASPESLLYDTDSHLLVKRVTSRHTAMGELIAETVFEDYREVDGVLMSFTQRTTQIGQEMTIRYTSIQHNVDLPKDRFDPPANLTRQMTEPAKDE